MIIDLSGTAVLVTGSSRGIGKAIAGGMGESGATVAIHYKNSEEKAQALADEIGNGSAAIAAGLENPLKVKELFAAVLEKFWKLDVLVKNAGIFERDAQHVEFGKPYPVTVLAFREGSNPAVNADRGIHRYIQFWINCMCDK